MFICESSCWSEQVWSRLIYSWEGISNIAFYFKFDVSFFGLMLWIILYTDTFYLCRCIQCTRFGSQKKSFQVCLLPLICLLFSCNANACTGCPLLCSNFKNQFNTSCFFSYIHPFLYLSYQLYESFIEHTLDKGRQTLPHTNTHTSWSLGSTVSLPWMPHQTLDRGDHLTLLEFSER